MSGQSDTIKELLIGYGLHPDETAIYLYLLSNGKDTALTISRELDYARTRVYRLMDKLKQKGLVVERMDSRGLKFEAAPVSTLEQLLLEREQELRSLRASHPLLQTQLDALTKRSGDGDRLAQYKGPEGIKQILKNSLDADGWIYVYSNTPLENYFGKVFCEEYFGNLAKKRIHMRQITSNTTVKKWSDHKRFTSSYFQLRTVEKGKMPTHATVFLYNDVYATYFTSKKELFGKELHDSHIADFQKQMFDVLWEIVEK